MRWCVLRRRWTPPVSGLNPGGGDGRAQGVGRRTAVRVIRKWRRISGPPAVRPVYSGSPQGRTSTIQDEDSERAGRLIRMHANSQTDAEDFSGEIGRWPVSGAHDGDTICAEQAQIALDRLNSGP